MNVRIQYPISFTAGIYYNGMLRMNNYTARLWMMTNTMDPDCHTIAVDRLNYFIYNCIDSTVFFGPKDLHQAQAYANVGLNVTTLPGDPVDQLIGIMLYHKIEAIVEEQLLLGEIEISSSLGEGIVYMHAENENISDLNIPEWWTTSDLVHCDLDLIDTDKVVTMHQSSVWRDLKLAWPNETDDKKLDTDTGNTVVFADFKRNNDKE